MHRAFTLAASFSSGSCTGITSLVITAAATSFQMARCSTSSSSRDTEEEVGLQAKTTNALDVALMEAIYAKNIIKVSELVTAGANVNCQHLPHGKSRVCQMAADGSKVLPSAAEAAVAAHGSGKWSFSCTPLIQATGTGDATIVKQLLDAGALVDATNPSGWTALTRAAVHGKVDCLKVLMEAGADLHHHHPSTPPSTAEDHKETKVTPSTTAAPAPSAPGRTPLDRAAANNQTECVNILLACPRFDLSKEPNLVNILANCRQYGSGPSCGGLKKKEPVLNSNPSKKDATEATNSFFKNK